MKSFLLLVTVLFSLSSCTTYQPSGDRAGRGEPVQTIVEKPVTEFPKSLGEGAVGEGSVLVEDGLEPDEDVVEDKKIVSKELIEIVEEDLGPSPYSDVPLDYNPKVQKWLTYFQGRGRKHMKRYLSRSNRYIGLMKGILAEERLPARLAYLPLIESGFNHSAHSHASAVGYWQFIYGTGKIFGLEINSYIDERRDPIRSTEAAVRYLSSLYKMFDDWYLSLASYNTGENRIKRYIKKYKSKDYWVLSEKRMHRETKNYVPKFIAALMIVEDPKAYGFTDVKMEAPLSYDSIEVKKGISLKKMAKSMGIPEKDFLRLNPKYRSEYVPGTSKKPMEVRVPIGKTEIASNFIDSSVISAPKNLIADHYWYRVRRGDTLSGIADRNRTRASTIRRLNNMGRRSFIRAGQRLKVPQRYRSKSYRKTKIAASNNYKKSYHKVKKGETLSQIAESYGVGLSHVRRWNNLGRKSMIRVGQKIVIRSKKGTQTASNRSINKSATHHKVRRGENLNLIAKKYGVSIDSIKRNNNLKSSKIMPGQRLQVRATKPVFKDSVPAKKNRASVSKKYASNKASGHTVKNGENLTLIAKKYGVTVSKLKSLNSIPRGNIYPGQELKLRNLASLQTHIVKNGENLTLIAKKYGVSVSQLISGNSLNNKGSIFPGQKLVIATN